MKELIRVENLVRNYEMPSREEKKEYIHVLKKLNFTVQEQEFVGIMGKSGCGKSTLLKVLGMIDRPTAGAMFFKGKEVKNLWEDELSDIRRRDVGFVFQDFYLMDSLSVEENIMLPMILDKANVHRCVKATEKLENLFEIRHLAKKNPYELSGGEKQRAAICRALVNDPQLILADEPTGNLDRKNTLEIMKLLRECNEQYGQTIVIVTHDENVSKMCSREIYIEDGKIKT